MHAAEVFFSMLLKLYLNSCRTLFFGDKLSSCRSCPSQPSLRTSKYTCITYLWWFMLMSSWQMHLSLHSEIGIMNMISGCELKHQTWADITPKSAVIGTSQADEENDHILHPWHMCSHVTNVLQCPWDSLDFLPNLIMMTWKLISFLLPLSSVRPLLRPPYGSETHTQV